MKIILTFLFIIHGLIHLMGFAKAFDLAQLPLLQAFVPPPVGLVWLAAAMLLVISGVLLLVGIKRWWLAAALGIVLSQILIFSTWSDAKVGTMANVILVIPVVVAALGAAPWNFRAAYKRNVTVRLNQPPAATKLLAEADIAHLPPAVQRYLRFANVVNQPQVWNYRMRFRGGLRNGPNDKWMQITANQQSFTASPARLFLIESSMFGIPYNAFHRYVDGQATFHVKVASLLEVVDAHGAEMNQGETVTLFNDMFFLAPASLIDRRIRWEELDPLTVRATFTNAGNTVTAVVSFDRSGALVNFVSDDRFMTVNGKVYENHPWSTPVREWREFDGCRLPAVIDTVWDLPGSKFVYGHFEVLEVKYNVTGS